jgi:hypothetical protein
VKRAPKLRPVYVEWVDSATVTTRWDDRRAMVREARFLTTDPVLSAGLLLSKTRKVVVLALFHNPHNDDVGHVLAIPRVAVRSIKKLR